MTKDNQVCEHEQPIDDNEKVVDKREFLDENGIDIYKKKSSEKTVEERIKTSRSLKIKHNKWNQVDYTEDFTEEKITIDPRACQFTSSFEDVEFEKKFHEIIKNSKYKPILLGDDKVSINYQVINDMVIYIYARMKQDYSLTQIFVLICEYCNVGLPSMWKRLSSYLQLQILTELKETSKLPLDLLENNIKLF
ncbi:MAG: hypothetical protein NC548_30950 [Lachnospiraceae bacterium]|nr:hypothetical protein [Lachnospiraceae bacterium]